MLPTLTVRPEYHFVAVWPPRLIKFHVFNGTELVGELSLEEIEKHWITWDG